MVIQIGISLGTSTICSRVVITYIIFCKFFDVLGQDVINCFREWDDEIPANVENWTKIRQKFNEIIQFHVQVKK